MRFKSIENSLSNLPLIQQSLASISLMMESHRLSNSAGDPSGLSTQVFDNTPLLDQLALETYSVKLVKINFPRFSICDALQ